MKSFLKFTGVAILVALGLAFAFGWGFWAILILLEVAYGVRLLHATNPKTAKAIGILIIVVLVGGWTWSLFRGNLPLSYQTLPWGKNYRDAQLAKIMDPGLSKARAVLLLELRKKEDALASDIPGLMKSGKYEEVKKRTQKLIDLRKDINKLLEQTAPPPPAPTATPTTTAVTPTTGKTLVIDLKPDQIYDVDDLATGQRWRYLGFTGSFSHRVDEGNDTACWKAVDNNLPWRADANGKLQIKGGNTAVKVTVNIL